MKWVFCQKQVPVSLQLLDLALSEFDYHCHWFHSKSPSEVVLESFGRAKQTILFFRDGIAINRINNVLWGFVYYFWLVLNVKDETCCSE